MSILNFLMHHVAQAITDFCFALGLILAVILSLYVMTFGFRLFGLNYEIEKQFWKLNRSKLTLNLISSQLDANTKWNMIELYGVEQFVKGYKYGWYSKDAYGMLYRIKIHDDLPAFVVVKVKNSTPEPDGSSKWYYIRVHPACETAKQAIAWTFGIDSAEYKPSIET